MTTRPSPHFARNTSPFFPPAFRSASEDDRSSLSSISLAPSEFHSVRTSPSPVPGQTLPDRSRVSPATLTSSSGHSLPRLEKSPQEALRFGTPSRADFVDQQPPTTYDTNGRTTTSPTASRGPAENGSSQSAALSVAIKQNLSSPPPPGPGSSSPVSSIESAQQFPLGGNSDYAQRQSFESQLKASPIIHDILDRLVRYEHFQKEIHRDLGDLRAKVNLLVDRTLGSGSTGQPEFKDPFASPSNVGRAFSPMMNAPRPSLPNLAPHQAPPVDDVTSISQRLNTLTSSVGQLLAIQTQQLQGPPGLAAMGAPIHPDLGPSPLSPPIHQQAMLGNGMPPRGDLRSGGRIPAGPGRTWSAGTLDLPPRPIDPNFQRGEGKRRASALLRRDSAGVLDASADGGPVVSKWEQLNITPELLHSLNKFGVGPPNKIQQRALPFLLRGSDIIAQAPPTQERIAAYVIPAIQIAVANIPVRQGPVVLMISTTVDQATQAQRMIRDLGGPIGIRSALGVGAVPGDSSQELRLLHQNMPHILCGTPQKLHALFTSPGGISGAEVRFLVLDEVDQLIARNLHDFVYNIVKHLPPPRSQPTSGTPALSSPSPSSPPSALSPSEKGNGNGRRYSGLPPDSSANPSPLAVERQTALFSNTVPQDVLNLASAIQLREPVRVLVRRDGNNSQGGENSQNSKGLRQFYLYLPLVSGTARSDASGGQSAGLGIIGSGRSSSKPEANQAKEWKLEALSDMFEDLDVAQAIVHVGGMTSLDSVVFKLASRGMETIQLHSDMNPGPKMTALNKFRAGNSAIGRTKVLVVYDVQVKTAEISHVPLIINYDLPKAVEEYAPRVAPAIAPNNYTRAGVVVNFVTAAGGDVEMLRSIECFYKIKCPEVPMSLSGLL